MPGTGTLNVTVKVSRWRLWLLRAEVRAVQFVCKCAPFLRRPVIAVMMRTLEAQKRWFLRGARVIGPHLGGGKAG